MSDLIASRLAELKALEVELHSPATRRDYARLDLLLHDDYIEFGRSGQRYTKAETLNALPLETNPAKIWSGNFELRILDSEIALLNYLSANLLPNGTHEKHTLRTSIWQLSEQGWQMRFHQGTPTQAFPKQ